MTDELPVYERAPGEPDTWRRVITGAMLAEAAAHQHQQEQREQRAAADAAARRKLMDGIWTTEPVEPPPVGPDMWKTMLDDYVTRMIAADLLIDRVAGIPNYDPTGKATFPPIPPWFGGDARP